MIPMVSPEYNAVSIIFGASKWPECLKFVNAPSFSRSAESILEFLRSQSGLNMSARNIKFLFDSFEDAAEQLYQAKLFVEARKKDLAEDGKRLTDLFIFYVGHGDFEGDGKDFYLSIRRTHEDRPLLTSITAYEMGNFVRRVAGNLRTYIILDCCFAAAMQHGFMTSPLGLAGLRLHEALPPPGSSPPSGVDTPGAGAVLLAAAGLNDPALAPPDQPLTAFTTALLDVLRNGDRGFGDWLSLSEVHLLLESRILKLFPGVARPEIRPLQQNHGRVDLVGIFPNAAWSGAQDVRTAANAPAKGDGAAGQESAEEIETRHQTTIEAAAKRKAKRAEARRRARVEAAAKQEAEQAELRRTAELEAAAKREAERAIALRKLQAEAAEEARKEALRAAEAAVKREEERKEALRKSAAEAAARREDELKEALRKSEAEAAAKREEELKEALRKAEVAAKHEAELTEARRNKKEDASDRNSVHNLHPVKEVDQIVGIKKHNDRNARNYVWFGLVEALVVILIMVGAFKLMIWYADRQEIARQQQIQRQAPPAQR